MRLENCRAVRAFTRVAAQVSIKKLKEIHSATHPSARGSRERAVAENAGDDADPEA